MYRCYRVVGEGDEEVVAGRELSRDRGERTYIFSGRQSTFCQKGATKIMTIEKN